MNVEPRFKQPAPIKAKGRARPGEPLAHWCQIGVAGVCQGRATNRLHRLRRSQGGGDEAANTMDLCTGCHSHVHANVRWAEEHGYLIRSSSPYQEDR